MRIGLQNFVLYTILFLGLSGCDSHVTVNNQSAPPKWERIGPGGGGATFFPTFSYTNPDTFLVRCDMTGSYLTNDGGNSYQQINFTGAASCFAFDPNNSKTMYIASSTLNKSNDGGKTWARIFPLKSNIKSEQFIGDHAELVIETTDSTLYTNGDEINSVRVDPDNSSTLYFSLGSAFFYSFDGGQTWAKKNLSQKIDALYTNSDSLKNLVYIFSDSEIFIFDKNSKSVVHEDLPKAMSPAYSFSAGKVKKTDQVIFYALHQLVPTDNSFAFASSEVWISTDYGRNWAKSDDVLISNTTGTKPSLVSVRCAEFDAEKAYLVCNKYEEKKDNNTQIWYGALMTANGGKNWNWVWKGGGGSAQYGVQDATDAANLTDAWVHKAFGGEFIQLMDAGVSPNDGNIAVVTDWYRTMKTTDGGKSWNEIYSIENPDGTYTSRGMDVTTTYSVHFDPFDKNHIAISYTDIGYFHSFDSGKSWVRSVSGVPVEWVNTCYDLVFDPEIKGKVWSGWSSMHDFPRGKMTRNPQWRNTEYAKGGICISTDGGKNWTPETHGMDGNSLITSLIIDRNSEPGTRTIYATAYNKGVFKSTDGGKTWTLKNNGIGNNTCAFRITQATNGNLFLVVSPTPVHKNGKKGREFYSGAVYRSVDNAESWTKLNVEGDLLFPNELAADPANPNVLYLACWSTIRLSDLVGRDVVRLTGGDETINMPGGIFRSTDGGDTWKSIFGKKHHVYGITVDPYHQGRLYCNTFDKAAWRSDDSGKIWQKIKGYNFHWGHRVIADPHDPDKVYLTTYGSSVWHGYPDIEK
jgi:photosystem II stability/assembly factor-like uncharacterized protein